MSLLLHYSWAKLKSIFRKVLLLSNWHKNVLKPPSFLFVSLVQLLASSGDTIIGFPIHGRKRSEKTLSWEITCINTNATHIPNLMPTLNQGQKNMLASRKQQKCLSLFPFEANILSKQIFLQKYHNLATFIECLKITKNISGIEMLYTVRLIRSFSNTVNFVFATSMPYSVQCAKTNMSYHHRNTTAFCSRRTTMVTRIFFAVVIVVTSYESPFQNVLSCSDNLFVRTLERFQSGAPLFVFNSYPKMGLCSIRFFFQ